MVTTQERIIRKTIENGNHPLIMPSTVMKAYCEPSIVLCSIGTNRKVQDMIPTYEKAHTLAGGVRQENNQRSKKI